MQTNEETAKELEREKRKSVTFDVAEEDKHAHGTMTFYHEMAKKRSDINLIKKKVCLYLREGKYDELVSLLRSCAAEDLSVFCDKHGVAIFRLAMADKAQLACLVNNIPKDILYQKIFSKDNFGLLRSFLGGEKFTDEDGRSNSENKELLAEKIKIILAMGYEDVNEFIKNNEDCKFMVNRGLRLSV